MEYNKEISGSQEAVQEAPAFMCALSKKQRAAYLSGALLEDEAKCIHAACEAECSSIKMTTWRSVRIGLDSQNPLIRSKATEVLKGLGKDDLSLRAMRHGEVPDTSLDRPMGGAKRGPKHGKRKSREDFDDEHLDDLLHAYKNGETVHRGNRVVVRRDAAQSKNIRSLDAARGSACGVGTRKLKLRLNGLAREGDKEAMLLRNLLEAEDKNIIAKETGYLYRDHVYNQKSRALEVAVPLLKDMGWRFGYTTKTGKDAVYIIYVFLPDGKQVSWHMNDGRVPQQVPWIECAWDGEEASTIAKLLSYISVKFPVICQDKPPKRVKRKEVALQEVALVTAQAEQEVPSPDSSVAHKQAGSTGRSRRLVVVKRPEDSRLEPWDQDFRWDLVDAETGEVLDDAQGYGYTSPDKAYRAGRYKFGSACVLAT